MPRRTRPSTRTTAIARPSKRVAETAPTLALTPVEIDAIVQSAAVAGEISGDVDAHPTVESFRLALGTASSLAPLAPPVPSPPAAASPVAASPEVTLPEATPPAGTTSPPAIAARGPRRTRESLRVDAIKPPPRKR